MADVFSLCWWRTAADGQEMKAPQAEIPHHISGSSSHLRTALHLKMNGEVYHSQNFPCHPHHARVSILLLWTPTGWEGNQKTKQCMESSGAAPKLLLFSSSAFPLNDQCHGVESQLWDIFSCQEMPGIPAWKWYSSSSCSPRGSRAVHTHSPWVLFMRYPGPLQGCSHPKIQENLENWQLQGLLPPLF